MTTCYLSPIGNSPQTSTSGAPLSGGLIYTYQAGTSTPQASYMDNTGSVGQSNPIVLNTYGLPSNPIWLTKGQSYKFVIKDALGNTIRTVDNVQGINDPAGSGISLPSDGTFSFRNRLHNGNFIINQRAVSGTVTLAAGAYGHDRWKAGAGGCTYTFATVGNVSVITVSAGSLLQIIEGANIEGGVYTLVNQGTAQARYAVNGGTTSGGYFTASSAVPLALSTATANQTITVEFTTGTIDRVQLEPGAAATTFERRPYSIELALCQRYYEALTGGGNARLFRWYGPGGSGEIRNAFPFQVQKRAAPTITNSGPDFSSNCSASIGDATVYGYNITMLSSALGTGSFGWLTTTAAASADL